MQFVVRGIGEVVDGKYKDIVRVIGCGPDVDTVSDEWVFEIG